MKTAIVDLKSVSPYSQSKFLQTPKLEKESAADYETRVWRDRMHTTTEGFVFIPPMVFKNCLDEAAKYTSMQIPGKGKSTYTKHFQSGVLVMDALVLPIKKEDVPGEWLLMNSDGVSGSGKRVLRCYPLIAEWAGQVTFYIMDETVTEKIFAETLRQAGMFIGVGRFRPRNRGFYGRFEIKGIQWS